MPGIFPDAGYIFQRKVVLYHLLDSISRGRFLDCKIELGFTIEGKNDDDVTVSVDFSLTENVVFQNSELDPLGSLTFIEVKNGVKILRRGTLKEVLLAFWKCYGIHPGRDCRFRLVHSCSPNKKLQTLSDLEERLDEVASLLSVSVEEAEDFARRLEIVRLPEDEHDILRLDDLELRSIALIDRVLIQQFRWDRSGRGPTIYGCMRHAFENVIHREARNLRDANATTRKKGKKLTHGVTLELGDLFEGNDNLEGILVRELGREAAKDAMRTNLRIPNIRGGFRG